MMFARDGPWRLLGALDVAALAMITAAAAWLVWDGNVVYGAVSLAFCFLWAEKAFLLVDVIGAWFPARFGMNAAGMYEIVPAWAIAGNFVVAAMVCLGVWAAIGPAQESPLPAWVVAASIGRATVPHAMMGWREARRMVRRPAGGE